MYVPVNELPAGTYGDKVFFTNNLDGTENIKVYYAHREGLDVTMGRLNTGYTATETNRKRALETHIAVMADAGVISDVAYNGYSGALGEGDPTTVE